jgi:biopolymer transport protein ExbD
MIHTMSKQRKQSKQEPEKPKPVYLRIDADTDAALASYISKQQVPPERTAVTLAALRKFLREQGDYPPPKPAK